MGHAYQILDHAVLGQLFTIRMDKKSVLRDL